MVDEVARRGARGEAGEALLCALARQDEVHLVVHGHADEGLARIAVEHVERALVPGLAQLLAVRLELLEGLLAERFEQLVLLLCVDRL